MGNISKTHFYCNNDLNKLFFSPCFFLFLTTRTHFQFVPVDFKYVSYHLVTYFSTQYTLTITDSSIKIYGRALTAKWPICRYGKRRDALLCRHFSSNPPPSIPICGRACIIHFVFSLYKFNTIVILLHIWNLIKDRFVYLNFQLTLKQHSWSCQLGGFYNIIPLKLYSQDTRTLVKLFNTCILISVFIVEKIKPI